MTVKEYCEKTGANSKTVYRKIAKYKNRELWNHAIKYVGRSIELDDYAMDFLLPDKIRAQTYFEACEKAGDSLEESLKSNKELSEYNDELIAENIELHGRILELSDDIKTWMDVRAGLVKECDETYSELQSEKASYAELLRKYDDMEREMSRIISEKDSEISRLNSEKESIISEKDRIISDITSEKEELLECLEKIPERIRRKYIK